MIIFVTGTGTDVGKTAVSTLLLKGLGDILGENQTIGYFKPVQTGPKNEDSTFIKSIINSSNIKIMESAVNYSLPASPDQAYSFDVEKGLNPIEASSQMIAELIDEKSKDADVLVVEGAGGLFVPFNQKAETWLDVLKDARLSAMETLLVTRSDLGTLNHTSLTLEALNSRGIEPLVTILSGDRHLANEGSLSRMYPNELFHSCERVDFDNPHSISEVATGLANKVLGASELKVISKRKESEETILNDQKYCWHPFTQHKTASRPLDVVSASGIYLELSDGRKVIDGISSWWVNTVGHGRPEIAKAISKQQQTLDHVLFAGATHKSASDLSKTLIEMATSGMTDCPNKLAKVFYSDNGSTAVEVGLKMAFQYQQNKGKTPTKFLALKGSYHGDTFGAMSIGAATGFHDHYKKLFFDVDFLEPLTSHISPYFDGSEKSRKAKFDAMKEAFEQNAESYAGVVIEPMIQGAGGMLVQDFEWTKNLCELAKSYDVPVICDEVFTGLGRFGDDFAFKRLGVQADIVCTSKGLTGGNLPVAVTLATDDIFNSFLTENKSDAFLHGHSFTANPVACAAANAALTITRDDNYKGRALEIENRFKSWIESKGTTLGLVAQRALGAVLAFELPGSGEANYFASGSSDVCNKALELGLFIRPLGNTIYIVPPLVTSDTELDRILDKLEEALRATLNI